jgi:hypothetical protein
LWLVEEEACLRHHACVADGVGEDARADAGQGRVVLHKRRVIDACAGQINIYSARQGI